MNIFPLEGDKNSINWKLSSQSLDNTRTIKMILETAQLLSTALSQNGLEPIYKPFNPKHPSCLWVAESSYNFEVLAEYGIWLAEEYSARFGKEHKSKAIIFRSLERFQVGKQRFPKHNETPFRMAMPEEFKNSGDVVGAYRNYYLTKPTMVYPENKVPGWFREGRKVPFKVKGRDGKICVYGS
jgi:hypothetical protein